MSRAVKQHQTSAADLAEPRLPDLVVALRRAWAADTSTSSAWCPENAALGQCAVTALIVQDLLGGDLIRSKVAQDVSHYWNRLPDGNELDLTRSQFDSFRLVAPIEVRTREYVLSFPDTQRRYDILRARTLRVLEEPMP